MRLPVRPAPQAQSPPGSWPRKMTAQIRTSGEGDERREIGAGEEVLRLFPGQLYDGSRVGKRRSSSSSSSTNKWR